MDGPKRENDPINSTEKESPNVSGNDLNRGRKNRQDEETATEITGFDDRILDQDDEIHANNQIGNVPGWIGLALAVLSFFMMPIIFGAAAIIVGFFARSRDANWLGNTSIVLGAISIIIRLFFIPF